MAKRRRGASVNRQLVRDVTSPNYLLQDSSKGRSARILSGRGTVAPGYRLVGTGKAKASNNLQPVRILKRVDPQVGQSAATPGGGWRYANRSNRVLNVKIVRQPKAVSANTNVGRTVIRPPRTALRVFTNGRGKVINA